MKNKVVFISQFCALFFIFLSCQDANPKTPKKEIIKKDKIQMHDFTGSYSGTFNGTEIVMKLKSDENSVTGNLMMNGEQATVEATSDNTIFEGKIIEDQSQKTYVIVGEWKNDKLYFSMTFPEYNNKTVEIILDKVKANTISNSNQQRNQMLVGTWRYTEVLSSGSGGNYMSFSTDYFVKFQPDGKFSSWTGSSAGGLANSSIESTGNKNYAALNWHTSNKQLIFTNPNTQQSESVNFYAEANRMMLSTNKSKRVYQRVN